MGGVVELRDGKGRVSELSEQEHTAGSWVAEQVWWGELVVVVSWEKCRCDWGQKASFQPYVITPELSPQRERGNQALNHNLP